MNYSFGTHKTCFLSPHSDDTFLELYFAIAERILPGEYVLCTVFSESSYVDISQKDFYPKDKITNIRIGEDLTMAKELGLDYFRLNEPDCLMRYGTVFFETCPLDEELIVKISERLCAAVRERSVDCIIAPFPNGKIQHYDHRILREVAKRVARNEGLNLIWTNDIPYSSIHKEIIKECLWTKALTEKNILEKSEKLDFFYPSQTCGYYKEAIRNNEENLFLI